jgi:PEP-CTERM putative exosortase interaction domain
MKFPASPFPRAFPFRKALLPVTLGCAAISAHAANNFWAVDGPALWVDDANWSLGTAPTGSDVAIINNGGTALVGEDIITVSNLRLVDGSLTIEGGVIGNVSDIMRIGDYAHSSQEGTVNLTMSNSGSNAPSMITAAGRLYIADGNGASTTVSTVNLTLSGDSTISSASDYVVIGRQGGKATVVLNDEAKIEKVGTTNRFVIADGASGIADITLNGHSSLISATRMDLGNGGQSDVKMYGTSEISTINGEIYIGNGATATSTLLVSDNAIVTKGGTSGFITVARDNSTGTLIVEKDGQVISAQHLRLGEGAAADATMILRDNAIVTIANRLDMGVVDGQGAKATLTMSDEAEIIISGNASVAIGAGNGSQADFTLSDSASITGSNSKWKVGDFGGVTNSGTSAITLNGSSSLELREMTVGHIGDSSSTATVTINDNATVKVNDFVTIGRDDNAVHGGMNGRIILNGGTLATKSIRQGGIDAGAEPNATRNNITANGGTIQALDSEVDFFQATAHNLNRPYVQIEAGGLTFDTQEFQVLVQGTVLHGTGDFTKIGMGELVFFDAQTYTGNTIVEEGMLTISTAYLSDFSAVYLSEGVTLTLDFEGTDQIHALFIDGVLQDEGVYDSSNLGDYLAGTGSLTVVVPEPSTCALLGFGLIGLVAHVRRMRRKNA